MHEFDFIASLLAPLSEPNKGALGLSDDAAVLRPPEGHELVVTTDALIQGVHFIGNEPPDLIARKLMRVNLSDLAAMGAKPYGYFLALMLPEAADEVWLTTFAAGLHADQDEFRLSLLGGDTTRTPGVLTLAATALGVVPVGESLRRSGAKDGDDLYVSGTLGDSALGLKIAKGKLEAGMTQRQFLLSRYRLPQPRLQLGRGLRKLASACMDVSDGLMQDLEHICAASGVGAELRFDALPLSKAAQSVLPFCGNAYESVLAGGDDYELLFTAAPAQADSIAALAAQVKTQVTRIGRVTAHKEVKALDTSGAEIPLTLKGYRHF